MKQLFVPLAISEVIETLREGGAGGNFELTRMSQNKQPQKYRFSNSWASVFPEKNSFDWRGGGGGRYF